MTHKPSTTAVFNHERLDAYRVALQFAQWLHEVSHRLPAGHSALRDQASRAAESVVLNLAEGAQQPSATVARRHYRIALGSAAECAAALDLFRIYGLTVTQEGQALIGRVGAMLRRLAR